METRRTNRELEEIEFRLLIEAVRLCYGFDFRDYAPASLHRRIRKYLEREDLSSITALQERILHDPGCIERFLNTVCIDVTEMFRDPELYLAFRAMVVPGLREREHVRLWHAGCAGGEEVYSMAIVLVEEGLYDRCRLYATDMNQAALERAKAGIVPLKTMQGYTAGYLKAGGKRSFSEYYTANYENAKLASALASNIVWAQHNLVTDASFNEFDVILCRNVMIYFNQALQNRVHSLIYESLARGGVLGLGSKESLRFSPHEACYEVVDERAKLFRKAR